MHRSKLATFAVVLAMALLLGACAAGDPRYSVDDPAGFWAGLWHGIISLIALFLSLFTEVAFYEGDNTGWWYNAGFLMGILIISGGGGGRVGWRSGHRRGCEVKRDQEWEELGRKLEAKFSAKMRTWAEAGPDEDWETLAPKVEAKLKRELRKWADEP